MDAVLQKSIEVLVDLLIKPLERYLRKQYGNVKIDLLQPFKTYLDNAANRLNRVKTIATGNDSRLLKGLDAIYVPLRVSYSGKEILVEKTSDLLRNPFLDLNNKILITGTGGSGKSILIRYLFLDAISNASLIPVFIKLEMIKSFEPDNTSIESLVKTSLGDYGLTLLDDQLEYCLRKGKFLILMDGVDEVPSSLIEKTAVSIQAFSSKYPDNSYIVTSRPNFHNHNLETFTEVKMMNLNIDQAEDLVIKLGKHEHIAKEFAQIVREELFINYRDFAENPLLLSMMYLVYMRNNSIPASLVEFYDTTYDVLYTLHDSYDKGAFHREFLNINLSKNDFKSLFARVCFQSYCNELYEFTPKQIIVYLEDSIKELKLSTVSVVDFLHDLTHIVCILIKDGSNYRFLHRSFQTYLAAWYMSESLKDDEQKELAKIFYQKKNFPTDFFKFLYQLDPNKFKKNILSDTVSLIEEQMRKADDPYKWLLGHTVILLGYVNVGEAICWIGSMTDPSYTEMYNDVVINNCNRLIQSLFVKKPWNQNELGEYILSLVEKGILDEGPLYDFQYVVLTILDYCTVFSADEKNKIWELAIKAYSIPEHYKAIYQILEDVDIIRESNDRDELFKKY